MPEEARFQTGVNPLAISPDGSTIAFLTADGQVGLRRLDEPEARTVSGISGKPSHITFSPDGQWIAYRQASAPDSSLGTLLQKIPVGGGVPVTLCQTKGVFKHTDNTFSLSWSGHAILFSDSTSGIWSVPESGGDAQALVSFDPADGALVSDIQVLDDGDHLLYSTHKEGTTWRAGDIVLRSLRTGAQQVLVRGATNANLVSGYLLFSRDTTIFAQPFDSGRLMLTGAPRSMLDSVRSTSSGRAVWVISVKAPSPMLREEIRIRTPSCGSTVKDTRCQSMRRLATINSRACHRTAQRCW